MICDVLAASMLTRLVEDIGIMGISSIAGALLVGILAFAKINEKPRGMVSYYIHRIPKSFSLLVLKSSHNA